MTERQKSVLDEHAARAGDPEIDLETVMAAGSRRVRGRFTAGAGLAAAALVAATVTAPHLLASDEPSPAHAAAAFAHRQVSYGSGSTIHVGRQAYDVGRPVRTYVLTDDGIVYVSRTSVYFTAGGNSVRIGATGQDYGTLLAAGDSGSYVTWLDTAAHRFKVYDTAKQRILASVASTGDPAGEFDVNRVQALDGSTAYWLNARRVIAYDIGSGAQTVVAVNKDSHWLKDVSGGTFAHGVARDEQTRVVIGAPDSTRPRFWGGDHVTLSPDASYFSGDLWDSERLFALPGGRQVTPSLPRYRFIAVVNWLDDDRYVLLGGPRGTDGERIDILTCRASTERCTVSARDAASSQTLVVPTGTDLRD